MKRVLVAMSGGVDSSVSAALLLDQGYEVIGVTMQVWDYSDADCEEGFGTCCSSVDAADAARVAQKLKIPFYVINCEEEFKEKVIDPFVDSYQKGETPIPCLNCNTHLKFHYLVQKMKDLECDFLATGHYAKIENQKGKWKIYQSDDHWKDQTYFLFTTPLRLLPQLLFPVGGMDKSEVRRIAKEKQLPVFDKKDSTGLCFIGKSGYVKFIDRRREKPAAGELKLYPSGKVLGDHQGIHHFTYGQRKRLGISYDHALYVIKINPSDQSVWLGEERFLYKHQAEVENLHWLDEVLPGERLQVKIRFSRQAEWAHIYPGGGSRCFIEFEEPQRAITPGQSAVIYRTQQLVGGGVICGLYD